MSTEVAKETQDFNKQELIDWMLEHNPDEVVTLERTPVYSYLEAVEPIEKLNFPDSWSVQNHRLTNGKIFIDFFVIP